MRLSSVERGQKAAKEFLETNPSFEEFNKNFKICHCYIDFDSFDNYHMAYLDVLRTSPHYYEADKDMFGDDP